MTTTLATTPDRSAQYMGALARANEVRIARAKIKRQLRAREITLADALDHECCQTATVMGLLMAQRRWGVTRARKVLMQVPMSEARAVGALSDRQRARLLELVKPT